MSYKAPLLKVPSRHFKVRPHHTELMHFADRFNTVAFCLRDMALRAQQILKLVLYSYHIQKPLHLHLAERNPNLRICIGGAIRANGFVLRHIVSSAGSDINEAPSTLLASSNFDCGISAEACQRVLNRSTTIPRFV